MLTETKKSQLDVSSLFTFMIKFLDHSNHIIIQSNHSNNTKTTYLLSKWSAELKLSCNYSAINDLMASMRLKNIVAKTLQP